MSNESAPAGSSSGSIRAIKDRFFNELREYDMLEVLDEPKLSYYPF